MVKIFRLEQMSKTKQTLMQCSFTPLLIGITHLDLAKNNTRIKFLQKKKKTRILSDFKLQIWVGAKPIEPHGTKITINEVFEEEKKCSLQL